MEFSIRLAEGNAHHYYPLPVTGQAQWHRDEAGGWRTSVALGDLPAGQIVVPSFSQPGPQPDHQFVLTTTAATDRGVTVPLHPVPAPADLQKTNAAVNAPVTSHIDCWHTAEDVAGVQVHLHLQPRAGSAPADYLLNLSTRPVNLSDKAMHEAGSAQLPDSRVQPAPTPYSQMTAAAELRQRICSPTALAMALSLYPQAPSWQDTISACLDRATGAYGVWPLAIRWAGSCGVLAGVETFSSWQGVQQILDGNTPIVCSIRFDKDALPGAPMQQSGGHLVLLTGLQGDRVQVYDPAAADPESVPRTYPTDAFARAWLQRRGAAYLFSRRQAGTG